jgi:WD40 repeat protein/tRNA A-37 threonylcarbamoyl transferase component Bud32
MPQLYICSQGHRWEPNPQNPITDPSSPLLCPICGESSETSAFQDLEAAAHPAATPKLAPDKTPLDTTTFQDLGGQADGRPSPKSDPETSAFRDLPRRSPRNNATTFTSLEPQGPALDRSTAVTLRFPNLRRDTIVRPLPTMPGYEVLEELGRGSTAVVYKAREAQSQRLLAVKIIQSGEYAESKNFARLRTQLEAVTGLQHPCVLQVLQVGEYLGKLHIVMEYVDSGNLRQKLAGLPQPAVQTAQLVETLARTVAYAHDQGIVHRDLKPTNILLTSDGLPKIADFGLARSPRVGPDGKALAPGIPGPIGNNPSYLAPEQIWGTAPDDAAAVDIYALGAILYEMLTGRPPFLGVSPAETVEIARREEPVPPRQLHLKVPRNLETICLRCIQPIPATRYASAQALAEDLRLFLVGQAIRARPPGFWQRTWNWSRRRPGRAALTAVSLLTLLVLLAIGVASGRRLGNAAMQLDSARFRLGKQSEDERRELYLADVNWARQAWEDGDDERAAQLLERHLDQGDLRGFDWGYLWRISHPEHRLLAGSAATPRATAFSPNGGTLVTVGRGMDNARPVGDVRVWDVATGKETVALKGHQQGVLAVAFAGAVTFGRQVRAQADPGRILATGDEGGDIYLWDVLTGKEFRTLARAQSAAVTALAFAPQSELFASGSADGIVKIWNAGNGKELAVFSSHVGGISAVAFSPDGHILAAASLGDGTTRAGEIRVWEVATRKERGVMRGHRGSVTCLAYSADGKMLVSGGGRAGQAGEVKLWDAESLQHQGDLPACTGSAVALTLAPDSHTLAVATDTGSVALWEIGGLSRAPRHLKGHKGIVSSVAFSPDGATLAGVGTDKAVHLWSVGTALGAMTVRGHRFPVNALAAGRGPQDNLTLLASVGGEVGKASEIKAWDMKTGAVQATRAGAHGQAIRAVALSADGKQLATGGEDTLIKLWDLSSGEGRTLQGHAGEIRALAYGSQGNLLASGSGDATIKFWDRENGRQLATLTRHRQAVWAVSFSPDGALLASGDSEGVIKVWEVADRREVALLKGHSGPVSCVSFSPDGRLLASGGGDQTVRLWDVSGRLVKAILRGHEQAVTSVAFAPDGTLLASASRDATIRLWDIASGHTRLVLRGHTSWVQAVVFSPDGKTLASAGADQTIRLWQATLDPPS